MQILKMRKLKLELKNNNEDKLDTIFSKREEFMKLIKKHTMIKNQ